MKNLDRMISHKDLLCRIIRVQYGGSRGSQPAESETTDASRFRLRLRLRLREKREIMTNGVDEEMLVT